MLSKHRTRGRGGVGSRADETGPYLPEAEGVSALEGVVRGPQAPSWLRQANERLDAAALLDMDLPQLLQQIAQARKQSKGSKSDKKSSSKKSKSKKGSKKSKRDKDKKRSKKAKRSKRNKERSK